MVYCTKISIIELTKISLFIIDIAKIKLATIDVYKNQLICTKAQLVDYEDLNINLSYTYF